MSCVAEAGAAGVAAGAGVAGAAAGLRGAATSGDDGGDQRAALHHAGLIAPRGAHERARDERAREQSGARCDDDAPRIGRVQDDDGARDQHRDARGEARGEHEPRSGGAPLDLDDRPPREREHRVPRDAGEPDQRAHVLQHAVDDHAAADDGDRDPAIELAREQVLAQPAACVRPSHARCV